MSVVNQVEQFIEQVKDLRVAVVGETITDVFTKVAYEGQSMKSFCPVFRLDHSDSEYQEGGAAAIANHLKDFVKHVELISNDKDEIVKQRYIDAQNGKKHIEINNFNLKDRGVIKLDTNDYDVVIVADFGHGFCDALDINDGFILMCQTNSNNFGFNRVSKWKDLRKKGICIDLREASLQMNKRISSPSDQDIVEMHGYEMNSDSLLVTVGGDGAIFTDGEIVERQSTFKTTIVDTIGAGDAFLAFSSLIHKTNLPVGGRLATPCLAASLTTTWLCNEESLTREKLVNHARKYV